MSGLPDLRTMFAELGQAVLRHGVRRSVFARPQQGQRGRRLASAAAIRRRIVAIELGTCRSGRSGGASGSIIFGNDNVREQRGGTSAGGGNRLPFGDQEAIRGDAQRGVVVEAAPAAALEVSEPELLLELLIVAFDAPAQFGYIDQLLERDIERKIGQPVLGRSFLAFRPLDQQPLFRLPSEPNPYAREARLQPFDGALSPPDDLPGVVAKPERDVLDRCQIRILLACLR